MSEQQNAREALETAFELNQLLGSDLDRESLSIIIQLCEIGINPEALAACVKELRSEAQAIQQRQLNERQQQQKN
jgi:mitotic-spindle organizing protein 1